ncbi:MAG: cell division protein ZapA [Alphaproteobacteria bacterium]|nr:cell division protein ZapA [Alphaproteobacteria bacterium]
MAQVNIKINGYTYTVGCEDGQEGHLRGLAEGIDRRIQDIKKQMGPQGPNTEGRALMYAALMLADEVHDLRLDLDQVRAEGGGDAGAERVAALADGLIDLAHRIETVAEQLERH